MSEYKIANDYVPCHDVGEADAEIKELVIILSTHQLREQSGQVKGLPKVIARPVVVLAREGGKHGRVYPDEDNVEALAEVVWKSPFRNFLFRHAIEPVC